jgi:hypothetical protein
MLRASCRSYKALSGLTLRAPILCYGGTSVEPDSCSRADYTNPGVRSSSPLTLLAACQKKVANKDRMSYDGGD